MQNFDSNGYLMPYEIIEISLLEFELYFVKNMKNSTHRQFQFDDYLKFLEKLKSITQKPFFQWIDGSFVTKKEFPNDLDLVTFIDFETIESKSYQLTLLKANAKLDWNIDSNVAIFCENNHFLYQDSLKTRQFWQKLFGTTKANKFNLNHPKGFLQINFD